MADIEQDDEKILNFMDTMTPKELVMFSDENPKLKLELEYHENEEFLHSLFEKLEKLPEKDIEKILNHFLIEFNVSCLMGDGWAPHLLINGGILIRNFHRVISIELIHDEVSINKEQVASDLKEFLQNIDVSENQKEFPSIFVLHNDNGNIKRYEAKKEIENLELSSFGQTLIFLNNSLKDAKTSNKNNFFQSKAVKASLEETRGYSVFRVFKNQTFIHKCFRASDDFDTVLEEYSINISDEGIDGYPKNDYNYILSEVKEIFKQNTFNDLPIKSEKLKTALFNHIAKTYLTKIVWQIMDTPAIFKIDATEPTSYYSDSLPYDKSLISTNGFKIDGAVRFHYPDRAIEAKFLENCLNEIIYKIKLIIPNIIGQSCSIYLEDKKIETNQDLADIFNQKIKEHITDENIKKITKSVWEYFLDYHMDLRISLCFETDAPMLVKNSHKKFLKISKIKQLNQNNSFIIPSIGFYQGYCQGELDTGNYNSFLK